MLSLTSEVESSSTRYSLFELNGMEMPSLQLKPSGLRNSDSSPEFLTL